VAAKLFRGGARPAEGARGGDGGRCAGVLAAAQREADRGERAECLPVARDYGGAAGVDRAGCLDAEAGDDPSAGWFADVVILRSDLPIPPVFWERVGKVFWIIGLRDSRFGQCERVRKGFRLWRLREREIRFGFGPKITRRRRVCVEAWRPGRVFRHIEH